MLSGRSLQKVIKRAQSFHEIIQLLIIRKALLLYRINQLKSKLITKSKASIFCSQNNGLVQLIDYNFNAFFCQLELAHRLAELGSVE